MLGVCGAEGGDVWLYRSAQTLLCSGSSTLQRPNLGHQPGPTESPGLPLAGLPALPGSTGPSLPLEAPAGERRAAGQGAGGLRQGVFLAVTGGGSLSKLGSS